MFLVPIKDAASDFEGLVEWAEQHHMEFTDETGDGLEIRIGRFAGHSVAEIVERGLTIWREAGNEPSRFRNATLRYHEGGQLVIRQVRAFFQTRITDAEKTARGRFAGH